MRTCRTSECARSLEGSQGKLCWRRLTVIITTKKRQGPSEAFKNMNGAYSNSANMCLVAARVCKN